jgi:toxin HigB-1
MIAERKLQMIDMAKSIIDLRSPPGNRLEQLRGTRKGQWSVRINDQWRVCFFFRNGQASAVEIVDYH